MEGKVSCSSKQFLFLVKILFDDLELFVCLRSFVFVRLCVCAFVLVDVVFKRSFWYTESRDQCNLPE